MSADFESELLRHDVGAIAQAEDADRWRVQLVGPFEVWVTLAPMIAPTESFQGRFIWDRYPDAPPSLVFREPATGRIDLPRAWPTGGPFRPMTGLCVSYTKEGFGMHPEWVSDPTCRWSPAGNVMLKVIRLLQEDFDTSFAGRYPG